MSDAAPRPTKLSLASMFAFVVVEVAGGASALAQPADACIAAADDGQRLRDDGKLVEARAEFTHCAGTACPAAIQKACASWLADADERQPLVLLAARDALGHDLVRVHVSLDGVPLTNVLDGRAIPVNPGPHTFRFEAPPALPVQVEIVAQERNKTRVVSVLLGEAVEGSDAPAAAHAATPGGGTSHRVSTRVLVLGGVAAAALGSFAYFGLSGQADKRTLEKSCAASQACLEHDVQDVRTKLVVADGSLLIGVVALAAATVSWLRTGTSGTMPTVMAGGPQAAWLWTF